MKEKSIHRHEAWAFKRFGELKQGDLFLLQQQLLDLIDAELAMPAYRRREPEQMIADEVYRLIPLIRFDAQIRNVVYTRTQAWKHFEDEQQWVIHCGSSDYEVDRVRAERQQETEPLPETAIETQLEFVT